MARMHKWLGLGLAALTLTGCVSQEKYNALKLERDGLSSQLANEDAENRAAKEKAAAYETQVATLSQENQTKDAMLKNEQDQNAEAGKQLADLNARYQDALNRPVTVNTPSALPEKLTNALNEFAAQNPDLVDFDAARGIVKFKSDVTFDRGSADVTSKAQSVIQRFAQILNSSAASSYELMVAGHTDNTPVVNPETIKRGHKDNWYLSSHRAIGVAEELMKDGVSRNRIVAAGYADQRPVASNSTEAGKAQNRRVEVMILPTTVHGRTVASDEAPARTRPARAKQPAYNKDGVSSTDRGPVLNK